MIFFVDFIIPAAEMLLPVAMSDGAQSMGHNQYGTLSACALNRLTNDVIRFHVDGRRSFVQHKHATTT